MQENRTSGGDRRSAIVAASRENATRSLEHMSQTADEGMVVRVLLEMMRSKQIEVRVYPKEKLHAKAYMFHLRDSQVVEGVGIVGSSNLSLAGISHNSELNLKTANPAGLQRACQTGLTGLWDDGLGLYGGL